MEFMTKPQEKELNKISNIHSNEKSKAKGFFPKRKFGVKDVRKMIKNQKRIRPTMMSLIKTAKIIKAHDLQKSYRKEITLCEFESLEHYIIDVLGMDSFGVATFEESEVYKGDSIPYKNILVMSRHMEKETFIVNELPNMDCMIEVMKVYGDTGVASLKTTEFLRNMNFGAVPNHSLGGNVDYTKAGFKANLGFIGKHGMLITPHSGPCNRLSIVYTSIENLDEFLANKVDYTWGNEFCEKCGSCIKACPYDAIYENAKVDENGHVECISNAKCNSGFSHYGCAICIAACPFTKLGYTRIKSIFREGE